MYNKAPIVNYTEKYICFINALDSSLFLYISYENVDYNAVNSLTAKNFLLDKAKYNYCFAVIRYILSHTLEKHFGIELKDQKHIKKRKAFA